MGINEFLNHIFKKVKVSEDSMANFDKINVNNLRIVKLYSIDKVEKDDLGHIMGVETCKITNGFVLVEKMGNQYKVINSANTHFDKALPLSTKLHEIVIQKMRRNDRYRKPFHLCEELDGKYVSLDDAKYFANSLSKISTDLPEASATERLTETCKDFNEYLTKTATSAEEMSK